MMWHISKRGAAVAVAGLLALPLTACSSPTASSAKGDTDASVKVYEQLNALPEKEARAKAEELAKKEGSLSLYTENPEEVYQAYAKAFQADTGIPVKVFRASSVDLNQRVIQELGAGRLGADAMIGSFPALISIGQAGAIQPFEGDAADALGKDAQYDGGWMEIAGYAVLPVWNTDAVSTKDAPTKWEQLADPTFDGKLSVAADDGDIYGAISTYWASQGKSQDEIDQLWKKILDHASVSTGHSAQIQSLGSGQWAVSAWNYSFIADLAKAQGSPVSYHAASDSEAFPYPLGLADFKAAKHPAAAWLFNDWMLNEGQKIMTDNHFLTAKQIAGIDPVEGLKLTPFPYQVEVDVKKWNDKWDALLRGVPTA